MLVPLESKGQIYIDFVARLRVQKGRLQDLKKIRLEFERHSVNVEDDNDLIHPPNVCLTCAGYFYRLRRSPSSHALGKIPITWEAHKDSECMCTKDGRGRPSKEIKPVDVEDGFDTESGEYDEDEALKDSCSMFRNTSENLNHIDKELTLVLCKNTCSQFGLLFIDPENIDTYWQLTKTDS